MAPDEIEIGKTYLMARGALPRRVIDIIWHPAGGEFVKEYREAVVEVVGGKNGGRIAKESLGWIAENATEQAA